MQGGVTVADVAALLKDFKGKPVSVRINSPGGIAFDGAAIYNLLAQHDGGVTVNVIGLAASAASLIMTVRLLQVLRRSGWQWGRASPSGSA